MELSMRYLSTVQMKSRSNIFQKIVLVVMKLKCQESNSSAIGRKDLTYQGLMPTALTVILPDTGFVFCFGFSF